MNDSPSQPPPLPPRESTLPPQRTEEQQEYNLITDLVAGPNLRKSDNVFQLKAIGLCIPLGAAIGYFVSKFDRPTGIIAGAFFGLLAGLFGSGTYLMIYRAIRHARGKHD